LIKENKVSAIIPAYNEEQNISSLIQRIKLIDCIDEIIVVDDGSVDDTSGIANKEGARVIRHPYNIGNGAAIKTGAMHSNGEILVFLDSDGQHPPEAIPELLKYIDEFDMVVGSRNNKNDVSRFRSFGNFLLKKLAEFLSDHKIMDLTSGFRVVKKEHFMKFYNLYPLKYSYPTTITLSFLVNGLFVKYVPIESIQKRIAGKSGISPIFDGFNFLNIIFRMIVLFNPTKVFLPTSFIIVIMGFAWGIRNIILFNLINASAIVLIIIGIFVFLFGLIAQEISYLYRK